MNLDKVNNEKERLNNLYLTLFQEWIDNYNDDYLEELKRIKLKIDLIDMAKQLYLYKF